MKIIVGTYVVDELNGNVLVEMRNEQHILRQVFTPEQARRMARMLRAAAIQAEKKDQL